MLSRTARAAFATRVTTTPGGFTYLPSILSKNEQHILSRAALAHLDNVGSSAGRRKRKRLLNSGILPDEHGFLPDESYEFEEGHFDGVIRSYREARITDSQWMLFGDSVSAILERLRALLPSSGPLQTHVLHLSASAGEILPHIDNVNASGSIIMGVSLGTPRILRLEKNGEKEDDNDGVYDQLLEPGSCYIQRDDVRYRFKHSILRTGSINGIPIHPGQRLSIMFRDMSKNMA